ncbi:uncharacterized protein [Halyomorpha halys]|uniref:uncharacterized protein n=1 Tax=Halyomorpha halys TaxID=286706 RepID=UPI0006D519A5|nr:uncharacterized protein LOC106683906 [Halyomorpha halys]
MSSEGDKKTPTGWRVKVKNVIKVVSNNRKPPKMRPDVDVTDTCSLSRSDKAPTIKSPKFHVSGWTPESDKEKLESGEVMMLEVAETKFGIKPLRKKFRDQKLLIYTLPNENTSHSKVPVEKLIKISEEKLKLESEKRSKNKTEINEANKISTITNTYADCNKISEIQTNIANASETGDKITDQVKSLSHSGEKNDPVTNADGRPEPGKEEGSQSVGLFSSPLAKEESPTKGMYFGPHPINLQLDVN